MPISADTNTDDSRTLQVADPMDHANEPELNGKQMLVFRYRLWMLFLLFIPVAIYAKRLGQEPGLVYMESRSLFWQDGYQQILFSNLPDGTPPLLSTSVNSAYQSLGVSFSYGTPDRLEKMKNSEPPLALSNIKTESGELIEPFVNSEPAPMPPPVIATKSGLDGSTNAANFVGISGYRFMFPPDAQFTHSVSCYKKSGPYYKRFVGPMTIRFHQPDLPGIDAGVHRVGFYAARLNAPESLRVKLYTPAGRLIGFQSNLTDECVFMGFESKYAIGWLEIETIGADKDFAIGNLIFDSVK